MAEFAPDFKRVYIDHVLEKLYPPRVCKLDDISLEKKIVKAYLRRVFNTANTLADIRAMLPERANKYLPDTKDLPADSGHRKVTFTATQLRMFFLENEKDSELIEQRAMLTLLLK